MVVTVIAVARLVLAMNFDSVTSFIVGFTTFVGFVRFTFGITTIVVDTSFACRDCCRGREYC